MVCCHYRERRGRIERHSVTKLVVFLSFASFSFQFHSFSTFKTISCLTSFTSLNIDSFHARVRMMNIHNVSLMAESNMLYLFCSDKNKLYYEMNQWIEIAKVVEKNYWVLYKLIVLATVCRNISKDI